MRFMHLVLMVAVVVLVCGCELDDVDPKVQKQAQSAIDSKNPDLCDALTATADVEWCLNKYSQTLNTTAGCKNIVNKTASEECIKRLAKNTGNWNFCDDTSSTSDKMSCKAEVAIINVINQLDKNDSEEHATSEETAATTTEENWEEATTLESTETTTTEPAATAGSVALQGSSQFKTESEKALNILQKSSDYATITQYVQKLEEFDHSGMDVYSDVPTFQVGEDTWKGDPVWYASAIAHDSCHSKLYFDAKTANGGNEPERSTWTGTQAEKTCLLFQIKVLGEIGGDQATIDVLKEVMKDPKYQNVPYQNRSW